MHKHRWRLLTPKPTEPNWYIWCPNCGTRMDTIEEIKRCLNTTEELSAEMASVLSDELYAALYFIKTPHPETDRRLSAQTDALRAYLKEMEHETNE